jgi:hypothetical protein
MPEGHGLKDVDDFVLSVIRDPACGEKGEFQRSFTMRLFSCQPIDVATGRSWSVMDLRSPTFLQFD